MWNTTNTSNITPHMYPGNPKEVPNMFQTGTSGDPSEASFKNK